MSYQADVQIFHNVAGAPAVDVYYQNALVIAGLEYQQRYLASLTANKAGLLSVRLAGTATELYSRTLDICRRHTYLLNIAGVLLLGGAPVIEAELYDVTFERAKHACDNDHYMLFINGAYGSPLVDVFLNSERVFHEVPYPEVAKSVKRDCDGRETSRHGYIKIEPGLYQLIQTRAGTLDQLSSVGILAAANQATVYISSGYEGLAEYAVFAFQIEYFDLLAQDINLNAYAGFWNQIASLPQPFSSDCPRASAQYGVLSATELSVLNTCYAKDRTFIRSLEGVAEVIDGNNATLRVAFPGIPAPYTNYLIHKLGRISGNQYSYALIGSPTRDGLFILSRSNVMSKALYEELVALACSLGYDVDEIVINYHALDCYNRDPCADRH